MYKTLAEESLKLLKQHDYIEYEKNTKYLIELFTKVISEVKNLNDSKLVKSFDGIVKSLIDEIYVNQFYKEHQNLIESYLNVMGRIDIHKTFEIIYPKSLESQIALVAHFKTSDEIKEICSMIMRINTLGRKSEDDIAMYNLRYYHHLSKNKELFYTDILSLKKSFFSSLIWKLNHNEGMKKGYYSQTLYYFIREFILKNQAEDLNILLSEFYMQSKLIRKNNLMQIFIVTFFYFYYVIIQEQDVNQEDKERAATVLKELKVESSRLIEHIKDYDIQIIWGFYMEFIKELDSFRWEIMKVNEAKFLNIKSYFREYFIFLNFITTQQLYSSDITDSLITEEELQSLSIFFNKEGKLLSRPKSNFITFLRLLVSEEDLHVYIKKLNEKKVIGSKIMSAYKEKLLIGLEEIKRKPIVSENIQIDIDAMKVNLEKWVFNNFCKETTCIVNSKNTIDTTRNFLITLDSYDEDVDRLSEELEIDIIGEFEEVILQHITNYLEYLDVSFEEKNKLTKIISRLNDLQSNFGVAINTLISPENYRFFIAENDGEDEYTNLIKNLDKMGSHKDFGEIYLEKDLLELFNISFDVYVRDLNKDEVEQKSMCFKNVHNEYVIENRNLKLTEKEIRHYVKNKYSIIVVTLKCELHILKDKIGCWVKIEE